MDAYVKPEMLEIGEVTELTLGVNSSDKADDTNYWD